MVSFNGGAANEEWSLKSGTVYKSGKTGTASFRKL